MINLAMTKPGIVALWTIGLGLAVFTPTAQGQNNPERVKRPAVSGIVLKVDGSPASGVTVNFATPSQRMEIINGYGMGSQFHPTTKAGADGAFRFPEQAEAGWVIVLDDAGFAIEGEHDVRDSGTIRLVAWGRIEGEVRSGSKSVPKAEVWVSSPAIESTGARRFLYVRSDAVTDHTGRFVMERVLPGAATASRFVRTSDTTAMSQSLTPIEVRPGETTNVTIGGGGRALIGRVTVPKDLDRAIDWVDSIRSFSRPIPPLPPPLPIPADLKGEERKIWLRMWNHSHAGIAYKAALKDRRMHAVFVAADGTFRLEDVRPGTYTLSIQPRQPRQPGQPGVLLGKAEAVVVVPEVADIDLAKPIDIGAIEFRPSGR